MPSINDMIPPLLALTSVWPWNDDHSINQLPLQPLPWLHYSSFITSALPLFFPGHMVGGMATSLSLFPASTFRPFPLVMLSTSSMGANTVNETIAFQRVYQALLLPPPLTWWRGIFAALARCLSSIHNWLAMNKKKTTLPSICLMHKIPYGPLSLSIPFQMFIRNLKRWIQLIVVLKPFTSMRTNSIYG